MEDLGKRLLGRDDGSMFERFTERARRVIVLAQEEGRQLNHSYVGTEHILLGLLCEGGGSGARALDSLGVSLDKVRLRVEEIIGRGSTPPTGQVPFTPRAKKVLELALRESRRLQHEFVGTGHLLLGLEREGEGVAARVLREIGLDLDDVSRTVIESIRVGREALVETAEAQAVSQTMSVPAEPVTEAATVEPGDMPLCPHCGTPLDDSIAFRMLEAEALDGTRREVSVTFCSACGRGLGAR